MNGSYTSTQFYRTSFSSYVAMGLVVPLLGTHILHPQVAIRSLEILDMAHEKRYPMLTPPQNTGAVI